MGTISDVVLSYLLSLMTGFRIRCRWFEANNKNQRLTTYQCKLGSKQRWFKSKFITVTATDRSFVSMGYHGSLNSDQNQNQAIIIVFPKQ